LNDICGDTQRQKEEERDRKNSRK